MGRRPRKALGACQPPFLSVPLGRPHKRSFRGGRFRKRRAPPVRRHGANLALAIAGKRGYAAFALRRFRTWLPVKSSWVHGRTGYEPTSQFLFPRAIVARGSALSRTIDTFSLLRPLGERILPLYFLHSIWESGWKPGARSPTSRQLLALEIRVAAAKRTGRAPSNQTWL